MKEYTVLENGYILLIEGNLQSTIPNDPANFDYQRYLRWLENPNEVEHLTESLPTSNP